MSKKFGYILIIMGVFILLFITYKKSNVSQTNPVFSQYSVLSSSWVVYKKEFLNKDGRIIEPALQNQTTSEAQSYAMLRAVWMDDKPAFDLIWKFTKDNMQEKSGSLFGWNWGKRPDGTYGFMINGGTNTASDADSDIALALVFAANRWHDSAYLNSAKPVIKAIWNTETATAAGHRYLVAGNWAKSSNELVIDPSYFSPYAWRIFAKIDSAHQWDSLVAPAYKLLNNAGSNQLGTNKSCGLPPDWISVNRSDGIISPSHITGLTTDYSFDAMRIPWRIALDYQWNKDPDAKSYLQRNFTVLDNTYKQTGKLPSAFTHDCTADNNEENPAMYATALGYFTIADPKTGAGVYRNKILKLYSNDQGGFDSTIPYYEQNWLWFGAGLYEGFLKAYTGKTS